MSTLLISNDIEGVLDKIRQNSNLLSNYHRKRYLTLKGRLKYYRIPIIVISALNSSFAVCLNGFLKQTYISLINMFLSLVVGIIGSIEMFYQLTKQLEVELIGSKEFYILSCDIYKWLSLEQKNRITTPREFLNESYTRYIKLIETSITLKKRVDDKLMEIDQAQISITTPSIPESPSDDTFNIDTSSEGS
jgi:hypothetical protein